MKVIFTPLNNAGILRVIPEGEYGDEYSFACTMTIHKGVARLFGITKPPALSDWRAMRDELPKLGVHTVIFHRLKKDGARVKVIQLPVLTPRSPSET